MRRGIVVLAAAALVAGVPMAASLRLLLLHRAIAARWRPLEDAHRLRAELVPQLADVVLQAPTGNVVRPAAGPLPPVSGSALLDEPASFERWDFVQRETAGLMFELCQAVVASPVLQQDARASDLLGRLVASERGVRSAQRAFAEAVETYRSARQGAFGGWVAARLGLSERSLQVTGPTVWASPALLARCPLVADAGAGAAPAPMPPAEVRRPPPTAAPPYLEPLRAVLEQHVETWRPCAPVREEYNRKMQGIVEARRTGRSEEQRDLERDLAVLMQGPLAQCGVARERIFQDLKATGAPDQAIDEAWQEFIKSDRFAGGG